MTAFTDRGLRLTFLVFALVPLLFAAVSGNVWEDYYITLRASKNLASGHGFVFQEGEKVQTYTSPIGTLIPSLCSAAVGNRHDIAALWLFRVVSAGALGVAGCFLSLVLREQRLSPKLLWVALGAVCLDAKTAAFSSNGMETSFLLASLFFSWWALTTPTHRPSIAIGCSWAAIMWSRPDGFIYGGLPALTILLFGAGIAEGKGRGWLFRQYLAAAGIAALLYLPWFAWAWAYYGTPISNTIAAKGVSLHLHFLEEIVPHHGAAVVTAPAAVVATTPAGRLLDHFHFSSIGLIFSPIYAYLSGWPKAVYLWSQFLAGLALLGVFLPGMSRTTRAVAAAFALLTFYYAYMPSPFPWYLPMGAWFGYFAIALVCGELHRRIGDRFIGGWKAAAVGALSIQLALFLAVLVQLRAQQRVIEKDHRTAIGLWLRGHAASPHDTVFLEPLGYIGYYSGLKMLDFPGLAAPEVVALRRSLGSDRWDLLIRGLKPTWLVLRPSEIVRLTHDDPDLLPSDYTVATVFDASAQIAVVHVPGKGYLEYDQTFTVFHRKD